MPKRGRPRRADLPASASALASASSTPVIPSVSTIPTVPTVPTVPTIPTVPSIPGDIPSDQAHATFTSPTANTTTSAVVISDTADMDTGIDESRAKIPTEQIAFVDTVLAHRNQSIDRDGKIEVEMLEMVEVVENVENEIKASGSKDPPTKRTRRGTKRQREEKEIADKRARLEAEEREREIEFVTKESKYFKARSTYRSAAEESFGALGPFLIDKILEACESPMLETLCTRSGAAVSPASPHTLPALNIPPNQTLAQMVQTLVGAVIPTTATLDAPAGEAPPTATPTMTFAPTDNPAITPTPTARTPTAASNIIRDPTAKLKILMELSRTSKVIRNAITPEHWKAACGEDILQREPYKSIFDKAFKANEIHALLDGIGIKVRKSSSKAANVEALKKHLWTIPMHKAWRVPDIAFNVYRVESARFHPTEKEKQQWGALAEFDRVGVNVAMAVYQLPMSRIEALPFQYCMLRNHIRVKVFEKKDIVKAAIKMWGSVAHMIAFQRSSPVRIFGNSPGVKVKDLVPEAVAFYLSVPGRPVPIAVSSASLHKLSVASRNKAEHRESNILRKLKLLLAKSTEDGLNTLQFKTLSELKALAPAASLASLESIINNSGRSTYQNFVQYSPSERLIDVLDDYIFEIGEVKALKTADDVCTWYARQLSACLKAEVMEQRSMVCVSLARLFILKAVENGMIMSITRAPPSEAQASCGQSKSFAEDHKSTSAGTSGSDQIGPLVAMPGGGSLEESAPMELPTPLANISMPIVAPFHSPPDSPGVFDPFTDDETLPPDMEMHDYDSEFDDFPDEELGFHMIWGHHHHNHHHHHHVHGKRLENESSSADAALLRFATVSGSRWLKENVSARAMSSNPSRLTGVAGLIDKEGTLEELPSGMASSRLNAGLAVLVPPCKWMSDSQARKEIEHLLEPRLFRMMEVLNCVDALILESKEVASQQVTQELAEAIVKSRVLHSFVADAVEHFKSKEAARRGLDVSNGKIVMPPPYELVGAFSAAEDLSKTVNSKTAYLLLRHLDMKPLVNVVRKALLMAPSGDNGYIMHLTFLPDLVVFVRAMTASDWGAERIEKELLEILPQGMESEFKSNKGVIFSAVRREIQSRLEKYEISTQEEAVAAALAWRLEQHDRQLVSVNDLQNHVQIQYAYLLEGAREANRELLRNHVKGVITQEVIEAMPLWLNSEGATKEWAEKNAASARQFAAASCKLVREHEIDGLIKMAARTKIASLFLSPTLSARTKEQETQKKEFVSAVRHMVSKRAVITFERNELEFGIEDYPSYSVLFALRCQSRKWFMFPSYIGDSRASNTPDIRVLASTPKALYKDAILNLKRSPAGDGTPLSFTHLDLNRQYEILSQSLGHLFGPSHVRRHGELEVNAMIDHVRKCILDWYIADVLLSPTTPDFSHRSSIPTFSGFCRPMAPVSGEVWIDPEDRQRVMDFMVSNLSESEHRRIYFEAIVIAGHRRLNQEFQARLEDLSAADRVITMKKALNGFRADPSWPALVGDILLECQRQAQQDDLFGEAMIMFEEHPDMTGCVASDRLSSGYTLLTDDEKRVLIHEAKVESRSIML